MDKQVWVMNFSYILVDWWRRDLLPGERRQCASCSGGAAAVAAVYKIAAVAAVLRQVVVLFAQELLYSGHREMRMRKMCFPRSIYYQTIGRWSI